MGGSSARAGFSNGTGAAGTSFEIAGSGVNGAFINGGSNALNTGSNIGEPGRFVFSSEGGSIVDPGPVPGPDPDPVPSPIPLPAGAWLILTGLGALGMARRFKA